MADQEGEQKVFRSTGDLNASLRTTGIYQGIYQGRAGKEFGAKTAIHTCETRSFDSQPVGRYHYLDAAGRCTGSRYEVVNNGACTRYKPTAPYANDSFEWAHSVRHLHGSTARGVVGWKSPTEKELTCVDSFWEQTMPKTTVQGDERAAETV